MPLARLGPDGPVPELEEDEYLQCLACNALLTVTSPLPVDEDGRGKGACPACEDGDNPPQWKGFKRGKIFGARRFAKKWPGSRKFVVFPEVLLVHLAKLGLDHYDLAILLRHEVHRYRGPEQQTLVASRKVAAATCMSQRQVKARISAMVAAGYCEKIERKRDDGGHTTFALTRIGLTKIAEFITANVDEKDSDAVPGLEAFLDGLGTPIPRRHKKSADKTQGCASDAHPPCIECHPPVQDVPPARAGDAHQEAVVVEAVEVEAVVVEAVTEPDRGDPISIFAGLDGDTTDTEAQPWWEDSQ